MRVPNEIVTRVCERLDVQDFDWIAACIEVYLDVVESPPRPEPVAWAEATRFARRTLPASGGYVCDERGIIPPDVIRTMGETDYNHEQAMNALASLLRSHEALRDTPAPPVVTEAMAKAALLSWAHHVNANNATGIEAMTHAITAALTPAPVVTVVTEAPKFTAYDESYGNIKDGAWVPYRVVREFDTEAERDAWVAYNPMHRGRLQHAASERVSKSYTLPDTVQAIVDAAAAYEKEHGRYQDYRLSLRDNVFPVDKTERAIVVAYRKHAASEVRG